ncbi:MULTISPECIES: hypothetical protein [Phyllobacteriaceae]|jgi:hypothetical protein|uniref:Copper resistance protein D domain-containing protein n=1 Tax=Mesorhizobium hungaricum TaxID=1566387 RepID=A0A1C2DF32_9HYPH|nr:MULTISPECIES: hypothetical protein [Mesorhizobium]MBN9232492.1 hypothetical protein [Mesorhizobium sp.]MDQ0330089.1 hypothetical protein [Mesorhizobium sp. YL-MeA3-2017]OCX13371.1 hypothetical protein QV13_28155 [Mesorhizobium hungaricum]
MQIVFMLALALHVMSGVFWAGSTFVLSRIGDGRTAIALFGPQMGAATAAVLSGAVLWHLFHGSYFGAQEKVLAVGAVAALIAAGVQGALVGRARRNLAAGREAEAAIAGQAIRGERLAAGLLAITVIAMAIARVV